MAGSERTVNVPVVALQFVVELVKVKVVVPAATVVTLPALSIVATDGLLLTHVPPEVGVSCVVLPMQTNDAPPRTGSGSIVTFAVAKLLQPPLVTVYLMVAVPAESPVTTPDALTLAMAGVVVLHTPPGVASDNVVVPLTQATIVPVIGATVGVGFIVKTDGVRAEVLAVPFGVVTAICPVVAPAGKAAVICVALTTVKVADIPLKVTAVAPVKLVPLIVTVGVVPEQALVAVNDVIVGGAV